MAVAACALLVLAGCTDSDGNGPAEARIENGPLEESLPHAWWRASTAGEVFSDGLEVLILRGDETAVIDDVRVEGGEESARFLGARLGLPGRPDDFNKDMAAFPPRAVPTQDQAPAVGAEIVPGQTYMLILGYEITADVASNRESIIVDYTIKDTAYTDEFPARLAFCPPPLTDDACSAEYPDAVID